MRRRLLGGFVLPLLLALFTSLVVFQTVRFHIQDIERVTRVSRTEGELNALIKAVIDAQTGQRGFAITGDEAFLEPYRRSSAEFDTALAALKGALPDSRAELGDIDALFRRWREEVAEVIIDARRGTPVGLSRDLRGASTALTRARVAALSYTRAGDPALLNRAEGWFGEAQRRLRSALESGLSGAQLEGVEDAAAGLRGLRRAPDFRDAVAEAQGLDDALARLAVGGEAAEAAVTAPIRAGTGKRLVDTIRARVDGLAKGVDGTLEGTLGAARDRDRQTQRVAFVGPLFAVLASLLVILQGQRQLERSVQQLGEAIKAVAAGEPQRRLKLPAHNELRPLAEDFNRLADRLTERERQNAQLGEFSSTLQTCRTVDEAYRVTKRFSENLLGGFSGVLYRVSESRNLLEEVARWGDTQTNAETNPVPMLYTPSDCWALRRGRPQRVSDTRGVGCPHAPTPAPAVALCTPLVTQDETLGVLYLYSHNAGVILDEATERFIGTVAEGLALALSNLRLRESLVYRSVRDPLTGLFNRRHLEETLDLELHRAARRGEPVSALMFDIDHFKRFNDRYGHDAGDAVLRAVSGLVQRQVRAGDVACRFGGEEFLLVQPGLAASDAPPRAETLREAVSGLELSHNGMALGNVTISVGVATYPEHAADRTALVKRADEALYRAKRGGRNRVESADLSEPA